MKNLRVALVAVGMIALALVLIQTRESQPNRKTGDTLIFEQIVANIAAGAGATSEIFASTQYAIDNGIASKTFEIYEKIADAFQPYARNVLGFHANYILYLLAPLSVLVGADAVLAAFQILSFVGLLFAVFCWLQGNKSGTFGALVFAGVVSLHPAWGEAIRGQFYPDRGFILLGFLFFAAVHSRWPNYVIVLIAIVTSMLNERAPLILGFFSLGHAVMFFEFREWKHASFKCAVGIVLIGISAILMRSLDNVYYTGGYMPQSVQELTTRLADPAFYRGLITFLEINAGLLLFSLFSWRTVPIVIGLMIPNMFGSVGGAEKIGFATHYHSYYFPALVWSASLGFRWIINTVRTRFASRLSGLYSSVVGFLCVLPAFISQMISPASSSTVNLSFDTYRSSNILFSLPAAYASTYGADAVITRGRLLDAIALVPKGAVISSTESTMWMGEGRARQYFYPLSFKQATHLGMRCSQTATGEIEWEGAVSFLGPVPRTEIDAAFRAKAVALGFDFKAAKCVVPLGVGIVPRSKS